MPGVVDQFCKQAAAWERRIPGSEDAFGNPQYEPGEEILVRFVRKRKTFVTLPGEIVVTTRSVLTKDPVSAGDRITCEGESFVIQIGPNEARWLDGVWLGAFCHG
jgi:hypothetical protein